ncbi:hypothetical protein BO70DRAFT_385136 [Aspergillus heteromorphus CBS 117.55]|uniref:Uncharacterized protein n=1 Tax=Aspergillus heteromorphus CBS 117.55 TaxID=1448321 RepID=A0A317WSC2_9EURO|nr:uncharacterized protein BO70DRAFT_385136 [Aspergillus heteromorphus CBS 117.55]PWY88945.1 hypothetical protein BO70DRAFT_385136 [Aspergillus heteromorphus CBS 117.55]
MLSFERAGDFLKTVKLVHRLRQRFVSAPPQFKSISDASKSLSNVLRDIEDTYLEAALDEEQQRHLDELSDDLPQEIVDWLAPISYQPQQSDFFSHRHEGTGEWLLNSTTFRQWMGNDRQKLLCTGVSGSGKTVLTSFVIDHLEKTFHDDRNVGIAYIYGNLRRQYEQEAEDVLSSLIKQLVERIAVIPETIESLYARHRQSDTRPTLDELCTILHSLAGRFSRVFILVDALDEISDGSLKRLLPELFQLQTKHNVSLFATSRHNLDIQSALHDCLQQEISATAEDVRAYINSRFCQFPAYISRDPELREEIIEAITQSACGRFLLASLHFSLVVASWTPRAIRKTLPCLPTGPDAYDIAYEGLMQQIDKKPACEKRIAHHVLAWLTCARRPLTTVELQHALAVEMGQPALDTEKIPDIHDMGSFCFGLVTLDRESHTAIRLIHYSAQEYLERTQTKWFPRAHYKIARTCLTYLSYEVFRTGPCSTDGDFEHRLREYPLYVYASRQWGYHVRIQPVEQKWIRAFLRDQEKVSASAQALTAPSWQFDGWSHQGPIQVTGVHLAAYFGLESTLKLILTKGVPCNVHDSTGQSPLSWAAKGGHEGVVEFLMRRGLDPDCRDGDGRTPLSWGG